MVDPHAAHQQLHIFPDITFALGVSQKVSRVIGRQQMHAPVIMQPPAQSRYRGLGFQQRFGGKTPQGTDIVRCNGLQLAAVVLGGDVGASPNGFEMGPARNLTRSDAGAGHAMMAGRGDGFAVPCIHRDEVQKLPEGAVLVAGNEHSPVQAMVYEAGGVDFWGTQYHPEMSMADVASSLAGDELFSGKDSPVADFALADRDEAAAQRLGTSTAELAINARARELINWLAHVRAQAAT